MARVGWEFNGYSWAINPMTDTDWIYEHNITEGVGINAQVSTLQYGGTKSGRRRISGWIWGPNGPTQFSNMRSWQRNRTQATLTDHKGNSVRAMLVKFEPEPTQDSVEWAQGRQTYKYTAEFVALE